MKRIIFLVLISFSFQLSCFSQYKNGSFYLDANYNYNNQSKIVDNVGNKDIKSTFAPNVGYFVVKNLLLGIGFDYDYINVTKYTLGIYGASMYQYEAKNYYITNSDISTGFSPSIFVRYIYPITSKLSISFMAKSSSGRLTQEVFLKNIDRQNTISNKETANGFYSMFSLTPEIRYLITDKVGLQVNFNGYTFSSTPHKVSSIFENKYNINGSFPKNLISSTTNDRIGTYNFRPSFWSFGIYVILN